MCFGQWKKNDPEEPKDHALGRSRGGLTSKIHILCDGQGHPLDVVITGGQAHESTVLDTLLMQADKHLLNEAGESVPWPEALAGDKGYRADWIEFDRDQYRQRNIIERLIGWLKESRRIFTRFEKTARNFIGMIKVAFIHRYLRLATR